MSALTIRPAFPDDRAALERLAALDSQALGGGPFLLAEVDGVAWAAVSADQVIADPFRRSAGVVAVLEVRAEQLRGAFSARVSRRRARVPALAPR